MILQNLNIRRLSILSAVLMIVFLVFVYLFFGNVSTNINTSTTAYVEIAEKVIVAGNSIKLRPGTYEAQIYGPKIQNYTESFFLYPFQTKKLSVDAQEKSNEEILLELWREDEIGSIEIYSVEYFENDSWVVFFAGDPNTDTGPTIGRYSFDKKQWILREEGTGVTVDSTGETPASILIYLGLQDTGGSINEDSL